MWPGKRLLRVGLEVVALAAVISIVLAALAAGFSTGVSWIWLRWGLAHAMVYGVSIGGIAAPVMHYAAPKYWRYRGPVRWTLVVSTLLIVAAAGCALAVWIIGAFGFPGSQGPFGARFLTSFRGAAVITLVVGVIGTITESYKDRLEKTTVALREQARERDRLQRLAGEAQLASIESRIQPHFLFNTLNSISALIREDPEKAERLVERLAALLRSSLDTHHAALIPLDEELKLVTDYLEIQRARFGDRLRYRIDVAAGLGSRGVPPFSVQTLVENSVKHAVAPRREGGSVDIRVRPAPGGAEVIVQDDGAGFDGGAVPPGRGLDNLRARLAMLFGDEGALTIRREDRGSSVSFRVPERAA